MSALPWIMGGGAVALAAYVYSRNEHVQSSTTSASKDPMPPESLAGRWVWPVGRWKGRKPAISDGFNGKRRSSSGEIIPHGGVDIMYRRLPTDTYRAGSPNGSPAFVMPDHRAVLAASDGKVWSAIPTSRGWAVVIDHSPRMFSTFYTHMSELLVVAKQDVRAGQPIGVIGFDPLDGQHLMHLHFEVRRGGAKDRFDPEAMMLRDWEYLPDPGDMPATLLA